MALITAVIEKRLGVRLWDQDIYLNVVGGLEIDEPAADLGVAAAILSSHLEVPLPPATLVLGEIGLAGEVRDVAHARLRLREASMLGFRRAILPAGNLRDVPPDFEGIGVESLREAVQRLFPAMASASR
jgi:DNA repair protein RadA/Sms